METSHLRNSDRYSNKYAFTEYENLEDELREQYNQYWMHIECQMVKDPSNGVKQLSYCYDTLWKVARWSPYILREDCYLSIHFDTLSVLTKLRQVAEQTVLKYVATFVEYTTKDCNFLLGSSQIQKDFLDSCKIDEGIKYYLRIDSLSDASEINVCVENDKVLRAIKVFRAIKNNWWYKLKLLSNLSKHASSLVAEWEESRNELCIKIPVNSLPNRQFKDCFKNDQYGDTIVLSASDFIYNCIIGVRSFVEAIDESTTEHEDMFQIASDKKQGDIRKYIGVNVNMVHRKHIQSRSETCYHMCAR